MKEIIVDLLKQPTGSSKDLFKFPIYYQTMLDNPPKDIKYNILKTKKILISQNIIRKIYYLFNLVNIDIKSIYFSFFINKKDNYNTNEKRIIHSGCSLINTKNKFIIDIEAIGNIIEYEHINNKKYLKKIEEKLEYDNCIQIFTWSNYIRIQMLKLFPKLKNKISVLYPAIEINKKNQINKKKLSFTFIGSVFYRKGGWETLEAFNRISKEYKNITLNFISTTPKKIKDEYNYNKNIKFYELLDRKILFEKIYPNTDLLIFPTIFEGFGLITLEAYSFGIPVLGSNTPIQKELINNSEFIINLQNSYTDKRNFLDKKKLIKDFNSNKYREFEVLQIVDKLRKIIKNPEILEKESQKKYNEVKYGKYSINYRNKILKKNYSK